MIIIQRKKILWFNLTYYKTFLVNIFFSYSTVYIFYLYLFYTRKYIIKKIGILKKTMYQTFVSVSKYKMFKSINKSNIRNIKVVVESKTVKVYKYII